MNIKAFLFISALSIAQSNFGMKKNHKLPNDGQKWTHLKTEDDIEPFKGKIVKCKIIGEDKYDNPPFNILKPVKQSQFHTVGYGSISKIKESSIWSRCRYYHLDNGRDTGDSKEIILENLVLGEKFIAVRLLKLDEALSILNSKQFFQRSAHGVLELLPNNYFKLCDLLPKEQLLYFDEHWRKKLLLLFLAHKFDKESLISILPKDVLKMILLPIKQELNERVKNNQDTVLNLQKLNADTPNKEWILCPKTKQWIQKIVEPETK